MREKRGFKADSELSICMERLTDADSAVAESFCSIFKPIKNVHNTCGNVRVKFSKSGKAKLDSKFTDDESISSYEQISSPLALYRAISVFKTDTKAKEQDFYKMNWSVTLLHVQSGKILILGEWKGGFQIFTEAHDVKELPKQYIKDVEAFLTWFVSNKVPIGYDGVVAGSVA